MSSENSKQKRRTLHRIPTVIVAPSFPEGKGIKVGDTVYGSLSAAAKAIKGWATNG